MLQFSVSDKQGHIISKGETDNPYQVRNALRAFFPAAFQDDHTAVTKDHLIVHCSASLRKIMEDTPIILDNQHKELSPPAPSHHSGPTVTLATLCKRHKINPAKARRLLRKRLGARNIRYEWPVSESAAVVAIIKGN